MYSDIPPIFVFTLNASYFLLFPHDASSQGIIDLRSAQVYCVAIFLVSQEVSLNFHRCCG